ncbi:MAG: ATP-dependent DNA helicase RecG [Rhodobacteraceae bacterium]|nr:ATP-dependent DNA helicase RecG [Paracoccaceae bacterium]
MTRSPSLFPLFAKLETLEGVGPKIADAFAGLGVKRPKDLLFLLPHSCIDRSRKSSIRDVSLPCTVTVEVEVGLHIPPRKKGRSYRIMVRDAAIEFQIVFFHNRGDYLRKILPSGSIRLVSGRVELFEGVAQMVHPDHVLCPEEAADFPFFEPVYPLTNGITQKQIFKAVASTLSRVTALPEWIDGPLLAREGWPTWADAVARVHAPISPADLVYTDSARQRLSYDEFFAHQLSLALARATLRKVKGQVTVGTGMLQAKVLKSLPFALTNAQVRAIAEIAGDMAAPLRMNRLLQGDVGAGKTLVAFQALLVAVEAGGQGVIMAPTEILARQHYEGLQALAAVAGVRLDLLTSRDRGSARARKMTDLADGTIHILVGTHAVFQKDVHFRDLRLAIIDEQHRFGVSQRMELGAKSDATDMLLMTATPIPRSLALASYGDMDVSVLDEKPPGRKPIKTALISTSRGAEVMARLRYAVANGRQAYWVCPLVEDSEVLGYISADARFKALRAVLGDVVGLVHGQMSSAEKDASMASFVAGKIKVLVATTVIEVGVNVPNASIMVIERAETFGLAQLHQLRGRVGRGAAESTCLLLYQIPLSGSGERRLKLLRDVEDGFRIAEEDLLMRGAGDVIGTVQSGLPCFRIADLKRQGDLMEIAQVDARRLLDEDPTLTSPRGRAARTLLWLLDQDRAIQLLSVG